MNLMTITAGVIMSMYMDASQNSESDYCYHADIDSNRVVAQYVYGKSKVSYGDSECLVLKPKIKHDYTYDSNDRLISRITSKWEGGEWQPREKMEYEYMATGYAVKLSRWDQLFRHFKQPMEKVVYSD